MNKVNPSTNRTRKVYEAPAVVCEAPLEVRAVSPEVRAGSPMVKIFGKSVKGLTDPARLWSK